MSQVPAGQVYAKENELCIKLRDGGENSQIGKAVRELVQSVWDTDIKLRRYYRQLIPYMRMSDDTSQIPLLDLPKMLTYEQRCEAQGLDLS